VRIWAAFLLIALIAGGRLARRNRDPRMLWVFVTCVAVAVLLNMERFG
jgi:hypothetical protein